MILGALHHVGPGVTPCHVELVTTKYLADEPVFESEV